MNLRENKPRIKFYISTIQLVVIMISMCYNYVNLQQFRSVKKEMGLFDKEYYRSDNTPLLDLRCISISHIDDDFVTTFKYDNLNIPPPGLAWSNSTREVKKYVYKFNTSQEVNISNTIYMAVSDCKVLEKGFGVVVVLFYTICAIACNYLIFKLRPTEEEPDEKTPQRIAKCLKFLLLLGYTPFYASMVQPYAKTFDNNHVIYTLYQRWQGGDDNLHDWWKISEIFFSVGIFPLGIIVSFVYALANIDKMFLIKFDVLMKMPDFISNYEIFTNASVIPFYLIFNELFVYSLVILSETDAHEFIEQIKQTIRTKQTKQTKQKKQIQMAAISPSDPQNRV